SDSSRYNGAQNVTLYADVNGKQFPITHGQDVGHYQVSWNLFDKESYSVLHKTQRNNEDLSGVKPLFTCVNVDYRDAWSGRWISTEVIAEAIGIIFIIWPLLQKSTICASWLRNN
uniref:Translocon-associated protein subunit delta n=1 Tax=Erpetoichthys calabaricus TaxID=27687 RepID=A0A8C4RBQ4_ERPCA